MPVAQTALSGKLKQKTRDTMLTLTDSIDETFSYSKKVESILVSDSTDNPGSSDFRYLPAIFSATESLLDSSDHIENIYTVNVWKNTAPVISEISRIHNELPWASVDKDEKDTIRREFLTLCEKEAEDERLSKEIVRLFDESSWEVCTNELQ